LLEIAPHFVDLSAFARDRALTGQQAQTIGERLDVVTASAGERVFALSAPVWQCFKQCLLAALKTFHTANPDLPGIGLEKLRMQLDPRLPAAVFRSVLQGPVRDKEIGLDGAWVRLVGHEVRLTSADEKTWKRVAPVIGGAERFRPPRVRDIGTILGLRETDVRRLFKLLGRLGKVDEVAQDHFFLRPTVAEMVGIVVELGATSANAEFSAAQFRDRMDNGRKVAIQILEFFDRHGVTLRRGDLRRVNKHRLDLFRREAGAETADTSGRESSPVGRPDFKSGRGRESVLGGFDSLSLPPSKMKEPAPLKKDLAR
jgi:selenocysteine-specific elongation factor